MIPAISRRDRRSQERAELLVNEDELTGPLTRKVVNQLIIAATTRAPALLAIDAQAWEALDGRSVGLVPQQLPPRMGIDVTFKSTGETYIPDGDVVSEPLECMGNTYFFLGEARQIHALLQRHMRSTFLMLLAVCFIGLVFCFFGS